jgi:O-antigen chain-terminating methyltransferase
MKKNDTLADLAAKIRKVDSLQSDSDRIFDSVNAYISQQKNYLITPQLLFGIPTHDLLRLWYLIILGREPDPDGYRHYKSLLFGTMPQLIIFYLLRYSKEGRQKGIQHKDLGWGWGCFLIIKLLEKLRIQALIWPVFTWYEKKIRTNADQWFLDHQSLARDIGGVQENLMQSHVILNYLLHEFKSLTKDFVELKANYQIVQSKQSYLIEHAKQSSKVVPDQVDLSQERLSKDGLHAAMEAYYVAFEDAHRGSSELIQRGFDDYEFIFRELPSAGGAILDLGCGRGEWLRWLQGRGHQACGIDSNPVMVKLCQSHGLSVQVADLLQYLRQQASGSHALITAFHVIEHLPFDVLFEMVQQIHRVLVPGGLVVLETPNPENLIVGAHTFYHDFSHRAPVTPVSLSFLGKYQGFVDVRLFRRNAHPAEDQLIGLDPITKRLNHYLCGPQDYALVAKAPSVS